ncbi:MAG: adenylate/guanylate cyclase domain-containing protein [Candidatus Wallbacteria bacterium]|nr:adenylate/guanylate cyclase domain-containing protein [Candidatus Wallbacteria bacterium]
MSSKVLTIMFTDIKGFTARTSASTRGELTALLEKHENLLLPVVRRFEGSLVKTIGDAFLVTFESPTNAVLCGVMMQEVLRVHNSPLPLENQIAVRISIHTGEVELRDGDIYGEPVNLAARLEGITDAGEVYFTEAVFMAMNRAEVPSSEIGFHVFKGIPDQIKVFRVMQDRKSDVFIQLLERLRKIEDAGKTAPVKVRIPPKSLFIFTVLIAAGLILFRYLTTPTPENMYQSVLRCIENGNLSQSLALSGKMYNRYPQHGLTSEAVRKTVSAQLEILIRNSSFDECRKILRDCGLQFSLIKFNDQAMLFELALAKKKVEIQDYASAIAIFRQLWKNQPAGINLAETVAETLGTGTASEEIGLLRNAGKLDTMEYSSWKSLLLDSALNLCKAGKTERFELARDILYARLVSLEVPPASLQEVIDALAVADMGRVFRYGMEKVFSPVFRERQTAWQILGTAGKKEYYPEINYHFLNLISLSPVDDEEEMAALKQSASFFLDCSKKPDWDSLKEAAGIRTIPVVKALGLKYRDIQEVINCLTAAFTREIETRGQKRTAEDDKLIEYLGSDFRTAEISCPIQDWVQSKSGDLRYNAFMILKKENRLDLIDQWEFFSSSLLGIDPVDENYAYGELLKEAMHFLALNYAGNKEKVGNIYLDAYHRLEARLESIKKMLPEDPSLTQISLQLSDFLSSLKADHDLVESVRAKKSGE